jgi:CRISPR-associated protein Cas5h
MEIKRFLIFDIKGAIAHFRKFYTNSSSLTYSFPPLTVVSGMIAGFLGMPRDSYYELFSSSNCKIGLSIKTPLRKVMQTVNYIRTKNEGELNGSAGHTQIPIEFIFPQKDIIRYRVFFFHKDDRLLEEFKERLFHNTPIYPVYLGLSELTGEIGYIDFIDKKNITFEKEGKTRLSTVVNIENIREKGIIFEENDSPLQYIKERVPVEFNNKRRIIKISDFLYENHQKPMQLILKSNFCKICYLDENKKGIEESITFME